MKQHILLFTDGSSTAGQAGLMAVELARHWQVSLKVVFLLDESWRDLLGDEWMSNAAARCDFYRWLENGLVKHAQDVLQNMAEQAQGAGVQITSTVVVGQINKQIIKLAQPPATKLLVLPHPQATAPAAEAGLKYNLRYISKKITCPLLIGPKC